MTEASVGPTHALADDSAVVVLRNQACDVRTRSLSEIESFFTGLWVLGPGIVAVSEWRPEDDPTERPRRQEIGPYGAVGQVPPLD